MVCCMPGSENSKTIMFYVYILESEKNGNLYIGYTRDLKKRVGEHNCGLNFSTKPYLPWKVIYYEACIDEKDARRREKYLKTSQGRRMVKLRLKEYFYNKKFWISTTGYEKNSIIAYSRISKNPLFGSWDFDKAWFQAGLPLLSIL